MNDTIKPLPNGDFQVISQKTGLPQGTPVRKFWTTEVDAIDPTTGELTTFGGPAVPGRDRQDAFEYCQTNGLGYCRVTGQLVAIIPCFPGTLTPDWENQENFD